MPLHFVFCLFTIFPFTMALVSLEESSISRAMNNISKPGCPTKCGNLIIPYPFGIGNDTRCSLNNSFHLTCNTSYNPPKLFLEGTLEIYNISDSELRVGTRVAFRCYDKSGRVYDESSGWVRLKAFTFSEKNKFTVIGCDDYGLITGQEGVEFSSGCIGLCREVVDVVDGQCSGKGCCQTSITKDLFYTNYTLNSFQNHSSVWSFNRCGYAFLAEEGSFQFRGADDISSNAFDVWTRIRYSVPVVVDWVVAPDRNCSTATECKENSYCYDVKGGGYRCRCKDGYKGNPYLHGGCQVSENSSNDDCKWTGEWRERRSHLVVGGKERGGSHVER